MVPQGLGLGAAAWAQGRKTTLQCEVLHEGSDEFVDEGNCHTRNHFTLSSSCLLSGRRHAVALELHYIHRIIYRCEKIVSVSPLLPGILGSLT